MLSQKLTLWFQKNLRPLPWRKTYHPYHIWVSEIMLQQTTVKAVIPYYEKFILAFPSIEKLAQAKEEQVLALWSGLGYYSRARNLHQAAKQIVGLGYFPSDYSQLLELKGIGPYTAAAISSIAFEKPHAVMDGNVMRVVSRVYDLKEDILLKPTQSKIQTLAQKLMDKESPRVFNQAMMELGATVCVPQNPGCLICPIHRECQALKNGTVSERPVKSRKAKQEPWLWKMQVIYKNNKLALVKNDNGTPWLKQNWVLPGTARKLQKTAKSWDFKHSITKHRIYVHLTPSKINLKSNSKNFKWVSLSGIHRLGVSSVVLKALETHKFKKIIKEYSA